MESALNSVATVLAETDNDTLLTGFSGFVILVIVVWLLVRAARRRR